MLSKDAAEWDMQFEQADYLRNHVPVPTGTPVLAGDARDHPDSEGVDTTVESRQPEQRQQKVDALDALRTTHGPSDLRTLRAEADLVSHDIDFADADPSRRDGVKARAAAAVPNCGTGPMN